MSSPSADLHVFSRGPGRRPPATGRRQLIYNSPVLTLAHDAMSIATWLFFIGIAGSLLVIVISFAEDLRELLGKD
jgi:hypothetical protein